MKTSTLLTLSAAVALSLLAIGCKSSLRTTPLPGSSAGVGKSGDDSSHRGRDLAGTRLNETAPAHSVALDDAHFGDLPNSDNLAGRDQDRTLFAAQTIYFDFDQANVRADELSKLDQVAGLFQTKGPDFDLLIEGHCDERGTEEYNRSLGERRALAIREALIRSGVEAGRVYTKSFGKDKPADTAHDEAAWSKNRRGEFVLVLPKKFTTTQNTQ